MAAQHRDGVSAEGLHAKRFSCLAISPRPRSGVHCPRLRIGSAIAAPNAAVRCSRRRRVHTWIEESDRGNACSAALRFSLHVPHDNV